MLDSEEKCVWFAMRATYRREMEAKKLLEAESLDTFIPMRYAPVKGNNKKRELVPVIHNLIFVYARPSHIQSLKKSIPFLQNSLIPTAILKQVSLLHRPRVMRERE
jgi:hypothetical protein